MVAPPPRVGAEGAACLHARYRAYGLRCDDGVRVRAAGRSGGGCAGLGAGLQSRLTARGPRRPSDAGFAVNRPSAGSASSILLKNKRLQGAFSRIPRTMNTADAKRILETALI